MSSSTESWESKAQRKREQVLRSIPEKWRLSPVDLDRAANQRDLTGPFIQSFLNEETIDITSQETSQIVASLQNRTFSALQVTTAFCHATAVAHQINPCLHELFIDHALDRAKELDAYFENHGKPTGPMHGLPVSLKDQFHVGDFDTTMAYVGWIDGKLGIDKKKNPGFESELVKELRSLGAVFYCKTSLPQTVLLGETINNIVGRTMNPHNTNLSCGGSSGGEGALLALRASPVGFGTDIAGSVRIPASFCGVFSIKPTPERLPYRGLANTNPGQNTYRSTVGVMASSLEGLELTFRSILSTKPWLNDPAVVPIPWRNEELESIRSQADAHSKPTGKPLKFGFYWRNPTMEPHPPVRRGIKMVAEALRKAGHTIVDWNPPDHTIAEHTHSAFLYADGANDVQSHIQRSGEPIIPELMNRFDPRDPMSLLEYQDLTIKGLEFESQYADYWNSTGDSDGHVVDAFIMPPAPHAAVIPGKYLTPGYTEAINLLNYSAVALPVTKADKALDPIDTTYVPADGLDRTNWEAYDPDVYHGGPVGVQIVTRKFEEEKALAIAGVVHAALNAVTK